MNCWMEGFQGGETTVHDTVWWVHASVSLSKPTECRTLRVNRNLNWGLWVEMMCQCRLVNCNRCRTGLLVLGRAVCV